MTTSPAEKYAQIVALVSGVQSHRNADKREVWRQIVGIVDDDAAPEVAEADSDGGGAKSDEHDLSVLTVAELKAYADESGIDLGDATKKADIIAAIEADSDGGNEPEE